MFFQWNKHDVTESVFHFRLSYPHLPHPPTAVSKVVLTVQSVDNYQVISDHCGNHLEKLAYWKLCCVTMTTGKWDALTSCAITTYLTGFSIRWFRCLFTLGPSSRHRLWNHCSANLLRTVLYFLLFVFEWQSSKIPTRCLFTNPLMRSWLVELRRWMSLHTLPRIQIMLLLLNC